MTKTLVGTPDPPEPQRAQRINTSSTWGVSITNCEVTGTMVVFDAVSNSYTFTYTNITGDEE